MHKTYTIDIFKLNEKAEQTMDGPYYSDRMDTTTESLSEDLRHIANSKDPFIDCAGYKAIAYDCCGNVAAVFYHMYH